MLSTSSYRPEKLLRQQPQDGRALLVDMDSFFASVEQQEKPYLRGKPVGVCPFVNDSTSVIAASIEAKRFGIKTGTKIPLAKELCPQIILLEDHPQLYRRYHHAIMGSLNQTRCQVTIKSIDEAFLLVPRDLRENVINLAGSVRQKIYAVGDRLHCSIGISSNLFLAKMASNLIKPNGLTRIKLADLEAFYSLLQLTDLYGISWRMAKRLGNLGIKTPLDFYHAPYTLLKRSLGVNGEAWYLRLRGYEVDLQPTTRRTIGHQSTIVPEPARTHAQLLSVASQLTYKSAIRLRRSGLTAKSIVVYVRFTDRSHWRQIYRGKSPFCDPITFFEQVSKMLKQLELKKPVRLISITATDLEPYPYTPQTLFYDQANKERVGEALNSINTKFGNSTIYSARQLLSRRVNDRIGFGNAASAANELFH